MHAVAHTIAPVPELEERVEALRRRHDGLDGAELIAALTADPEVGPLALVSSFGAESAVLLHLVSRVDPGFPVVFLDTLKLFPETLAYRDALAARLGLTDVRSVQPAPRDLDRYDPDGGLWSIDADLCCHIRKTEPLERALAGFDGWLTGRKRFHGGNRAALPTIEGDVPTGRIKVNPLATWDSERLARHMGDHDLPRHPLVDDGYLSIGCVPCTRKVAAGEDVRAGRWAWLDKTECGIHGEGI